MESYDIFISYRRDTGKEFARPIKLELEKNGYSVFLDFDGIRDGRINQKIKDAISSSPIFIVILSENALDRCTNEDDWVRQEIEYALALQKHIIPVNPDSSFTGFPENIPNQIVNGLGLHQYSEIQFGQLFEDSVRKMVRERIVPNIKRTNRRKRLLWSISIFVIIALFLVWLVFYLKRTSYIDTSNLECIVVNGEPMEFVYVNGGSFLMGADATDTLNRSIKVSPYVSRTLDIRSDEFLVHKVYVGDYYIGKYEVTQKQWKAVMKNNPSLKKGDDLPVENITFYNAVEFLRKLNELTGLEFDLPTEAEWEYAARGGNQSQNYLFSGSDKPEEVAWFLTNAHGENQKVGLKKCNELGIYDMSGNVWEWCRDNYDPEYYANITDTVNPQGAYLSNFRTLRGGSSQLNVQECRCTNREGYDPSAHDSDYGFRIVLRIN